MPSNPKWAWSRSDGCGGGREGDGGMLRRAATPSLAGPSPKFVPCRPPIPAAPLLPTDMLARFPAGAARQTG